MDCSFRDRICSFFSKMALCRFSLLATITLVMLVAWTFAAIKSQVIKHADWGKKGVRNLTCYHCNDYDYGSYGLYGLTPKCKNATLVSCVEPFDVCIQHVAKIALGKIDWEDLTDSERELRMMVAPQQWRFHSGFQTKLKRGCGKWKDDVEIGCPPALTEECQCRTDKCNKDFGVKYEYAWKTDKY